MTQHLDTDLARLGELVGRMIPASAEFAAPGADDPIIFNEIVATLAPNAGAVDEMLQALDAPELAVLAASDISVLMQCLGRDHAATVGLLIGAVTQCYYRDARVMRSLGMEARPPFPEGFEVEDGDWSILAPVRARPRFWRDAP